MTSHSPRPLSISGGSWLITLGMFSSVPTVVQEERGEKTDGHGMVTGMPPSGADCVSELLGGASPSPGGLGECIDYFADAFPDC